VKEPCKPKPIGPISVVLPVPKGARVVSVDVLTPDFEITPKCSWKTAGRELAVTVDSIFIYSLLRIRLSGTP